MLRTANKARETQKKEKSRARKIEYQKKIAKDQKKHQMQNKDIRKKINANLYNNK